MTISSTFDDMALSIGLKKTIFDLGYITPTPIQEKAIPELLSKRDLLGQAQTGTGKTLAFAAPLVQMIDVDAPNLQVLVMCPTRELCLQVCKEIEKLLSNTQHIATVALYGGQAIERQLRDLRQLQPKIVVATPGRLFDHIRRKTVSLSSLSMVVLDEADEMLDMGFKDDIEAILDQAPDSAQRVFFSATMPKSIQGLMKNYLRDPVVIKVASQTMAADKIAQTYLRASPREKNEFLARLFNFHAPKRAIVFCNAKNTIEDVNNDISMRGFESGVLHGDLSQAARDRVMTSFRMGLIKVLVATDVAARGIDVDDVELVINYHLPHDPEDYIHRIGRTGRAGKGGLAVSLVEPRDNSRLKKIAYFAKAEIGESAPPTIAQVKSAMLNQIFNKVKESLSGEKIGEYRKFVGENDLSSQDLAAGLLLRAFEKFDAQKSGDTFLSKDSSYNPPRRTDRPGEGFRHRGGPRSRPERRDDRPARSDGDRPTRSDSYRPARSDSYRPTRSDSNRPARSDGNQNSFEPRKKSPTASPYNERKPFGAPERENSRERPFMRAADTFADPKRKKAPYQSDRPFKKKAPKGRSFGPKR